MNNKKHTISIQTRFMLLLKVIHENFGDEIYDGGTEDHDRGGDEQFDDNDIIVNDSRQQYKGYIDDSWW